MSDISGNLRLVRERIANAAVKAGRKPESVTLVAVSKTKPVEVVSYRLRVRVAVPRYQPTAAKVPAPGPAPKDALKSTRQVYFDVMSPSTTTVWERDRLPIGARIEGPAIVEQFDAEKCVVPFGRTLQRVEFWKDHSQQLEVLG